MLIASGTTPIKPRITGIDNKNVFCLRDHRDQEGIKTLAETAKKVVILGGGFIGSECASALKMKYKDAQEVHLVSSSEVPLDRQFGPQIGKMFIKEHEENGVKLHINKRIVEIKGSNGVANKVVLDDGTTLDADLVIVGAGVRPTTGFLEGSGIELDA